MTTRTRWHKRLLSGLLALGATIPGAAGTTHAQPAVSEPQLFVSLDGGWQTRSTGFSESIAFPETGRPYGEVASAAAAGEQARLANTYDFGTPLLLDASAAVRLGPHTAIGIGISHFSTREPAAVSAQLPHPLFFGHDRSISGTSAPLRQTETAMHLQTRGMLSITPTVTLTVFGGPTLFRLEQELVHDVAFKHAYPYDAASFATAITTQQTARTVGFHIGADITWYFASRFGIGWLTRYSRAKAQLQSDDRPALEVRTGGLHTTAGLRIRF